jgi:hypothetical protein
MFRGIRGGGEVAAKGEEMSRTRFSLVTTTTTTTIDMGVGIPSNMLKEDIFSK